MSNVVRENLNGTIGLPMETMNAFLVGKVDQIKFYDIDTFKCQAENTISIPLLKSTTREPSEIIGL